MTKLESMMGYTLYRLNAQYLRHLLAHASPALLATGSARLIVGNEQRAELARRLLAAAGHHNITVAVAATVYPRRRNLVAPRSRYHS